FGSSRLRRHFAKYSNPHDHQQLYGFRIVWCDWSTLTAGVISLVHCSGAQPELPRVCPRFIFGSRAAFFLIYQYNLGCRPISLRLPMMLDVEFGRHGTTVVQPIDILCLSQTLRLFYSPSITTIWSWLAMVSAYTALSLSLSIAWASYAIEVLTKASIHGENGATSRLHHCLAMVTSDSGQSQAN
ncbi:hypothetical protein M8C21_029857, partial [Ambrosia artemisiifolia]